MECKDNTLHIKCYLMLLEGSLQDWRDLLKTRHGSFAPFRCATPGSSCRSRLQEFSSLL